MVLLLGITEGCRYTRKERFIELKQPDLTLNDAIRWCEHSVYLFIYFVVKYVSDNLL